MSKKILAIMLAMVFILPSCVILAPPSEDVEAASGRTLVVETSPDFAPYDYYYGTEFAGIDMDIVRAIGDLLGYNIVFRQNDFMSILTSVPNGKCDLGASGFTISADRLLEHDFSDSYSTIKQVVVTSTTNTHLTKDSDWNDIKNMRILAQAATTGYNYAKAKLGENASNLVAMNNYSTIVLELTTKSNTVEIVDSPVAEAQVSSSNGALKMLDILHDAEPEEYGFLFHQNNDALRLEFNNALAVLRQNGTLDAILKYYADNGYSPDTPSYFDQAPTLFIVSDEISPYSYDRYSETVGIEADVMRAVANDIGYRIRFIDVESANLISKMSESLNYIGAGSLEKTNDVVGMFGLDPEEDEGKYVFSEAYGTNKMVLVTPKGSDLNSISDLSGKSVAVVDRTASASYAKGNGAITSTYDTVNLAMFAVSVGDKDCAVVDYASAVSMMYGYNGLEIKDVLDDAPVSDLAFLLSSDSAELVKLVNASILKLKADGTIDNILQYYADNGYDKDTPSYFDDSPDTFWGKLWERFERNFLENERYELMFTGLGNTLKITVLALLIGVVLGLLIATVRSINMQTGKLKLLNLVCRGYITIIRGTPVVVQLLIIYYVIFASSTLNPVLIASAAFGLNSSAYVAEIVRSGINSVPKGQMEAARCLGLGTSDSMKSVVVPQAVRNILPALGNESISLLKETSIAGFIGIIDLTRAADLIRAQTYDALFPLVVVAIVYLAIVLVLQFLVKRMERRLNNAY